MRAGRRLMRPPPTRLDSSALDRDALHLRLRLRAFGKHDVQHAILEARVDLVLLDLDSERDAALEALSIVAGTCSNRNRAISC
jgi:hypothetical protein